MRVGVLEAGRVPVDLSERHGRYADMFHEVLGAVDEALEFVTYAALDGDLPDQPDSYDAYIVTGSASGVYERTSWMLELQDFLRAAKETGARLLGICFGHQLLADTFGGHVERVARGWGIGLHDYRVHETMPWMKGLKRDSYRVFASHQDQVVTPPPGAVVLAGSDFCPNGMLKLDENVLSMQCHPEMHHPFAHDLLESRRERIGHDKIDLAQSSLGKSCDRMMVSNWIVDFLRNGH